MWQNGEYFNDFVIKNENTPAPLMQRTTNHQNNLNTNSTAFCEYENNNLSIQQNSHSGVQQQANTTTGGIGQRHLVIKYNQMDRRYYLRDLGDGSGTFIRVDNEKDLILKHGFIVSFGDSHMVV